MLSSMLVVFRMLTYDLRIGFRQATGLPYHYRDPLVTTGPVGGEVGTLG